MKQTINYSHFKFTFLVFALAFVVVFTSCDSDDDASSSDINRISMKTLPQVKYVLGDMLNLSDMVITMDKGDNSVDVPFSSFVNEGIVTDPENGKILELSDTSLIIEFGVTGKGLTQAISVTNDVTAMEMITEPIKEYVAGQKLDLADMVVRLTYENGDEKEFTYSEIQDEILAVPANGDELSTSDIEVSITHISTGLNIVQDITVIRFLPASALLITGPTKNVYTVGEQLDLSGTIIRYTLFDGSEVEIGDEDFDALRLVANPANNSELNAGVTVVNVRHIVLGAQVSVPITVNP